MRLDLPIAFPAILVGAISAGVVVARVVTAPTPPSRPAPTAEQRRDLAAIVARDEGSWALSTRQSFPEDTWSARDDFHEHEMKRIRYVAGLRGVSVQHVLRAIDEDLHATPARAGSPDTRSATAAPCKPRPFYD